MKNKEIEFETIHSHKKRIHFLYAFVCVVVLLVVFIVSRSFARYRVTQSIPLVTGTINYKIPDFNFVSLYVANEDGEYVEADSIPARGYTLNTAESYCGISNNGEIEKDDSVILTYENGSMTFGNVTKKGTKCYLYFDKQVAANLILAGKTINNSRSGAITGVLTTNTTGTVYSVQDDYGTSYVYAGAPRDNWVYFAGFYWRIIRINGDGSIRMIYNGTSTSTTGSSTMISSSRTFNSSYEDNAYVGYMYGSRGASSYASTHTNTNNSSIKTVVDNWYRDNLLQYAQHISTEAGFCGDRRIATSSETWWPNDTKTGYGTNITAYAPLSRFVTVNDQYADTQNPTLKCSQSNDLYTVSESSKGNHALIYPIGLITADEVVLAGGFAGRLNSSYYLYNNDYYWTMSPARYPNAFVFQVHKSGYLHYTNAHYTSGVRPVINLDASVTLTGTGISTNPYRVVDA